MKKLAMVFTASIGLTLGAGAAAQ
ncbi:MAG: hypothetical protein K0R70_1094, partial [Steroidobacteraceae bacterium]|nr:hypothetical protein [Steroidobacteraceae bacterium]